MVENPISKAMVGVIPFDEAGHLGGEAKIPRVEKSNIDDKNSRREKNYHCHKNRRLTKINS